MQPPSGEECFVASLAQATEGRNVARAVPDGRFLRVLPALVSVATGDSAEGEDCEGGKGGGIGGSGERRDRAGAGWRQRAGVRQLPAGDLLTLEEGYNRAYVVGDLEIVYPSAGLTDAGCPPSTHGANDGGVMGLEEAWGVCMHRDAHFPFLLAAYQHFTRAGWRVSSGLKYGATYLLYGDTAAAPAQHTACNEDGDGAAMHTPNASGGSAHGHAPFAVLVLPPRSHHTRTALCATSRKRARGTEASEHVHYEGPRDNSGGTAVDGSEATETWTNIQSFTRLAAHVSKRFIVAYTSYASLPGGAHGGQGEGQGEGTGRGDGIGSGDSGEMGRREREFGGIVHVAHMDRIKVRELHVNRWVPAQVASGGTCREKEERD